MSILAFEGHCGTIESLLLISGLGYITNPQFYFFEIKTSNRYQVMLCIGTIFANVIFNLYSFCYHLIYGDAALQITYPAQLLWVAFHLGLISITIHVANGVRNEVFMDGQKNSKHISQHRALI